MFVLKTMDGTTFKITDDEAKQLTNASGMVFIKSCGSMVNTNSISTMYPENHSDEIEEKKAQQFGVLHDGTRVKRHFGEWVDARSTAVDERGNYNPVRLDPNYYPEVARDIVPTPEEFEKKYKALPEPERLRLMLGGSEIKKISGQPQPIKELLKK